jgi:hypothetical protein
VADALASLRLTQRAEGVPFARAWPVALATLPPRRGYDPPWRPVVESTAKAWRRAYERQPPAAADVAITRLWRALAELEAERIERERLQPTPGPPPPSATPARRPSGDGTGRGARPRLPGRSVWRDRSYGPKSKLLGNTRTLDAHACRLRKKLGSSPRPWIVNVRGVGYKLTEAM